MSELLTIREVAALLRVSEMTIYRLRQKGELPFIDGPRIVIRRADIDEYLERKLTWRKKGHTLNQTAEASTKSAGAKTGDLFAAQQAQKIFTKLKRSSRISSSLKTATKL